MALPDGALPLVVGTVLALVALSLVLAPLIGDSTAGAATARRDEARDLAAERETDAAASVSGAVAALREIEFDRATGKLSDSDYTDLKQRYTREALAELRASSAGAAGESAEVSTAAVGTIDPVEAAIQRAKDNQKSCVVCGPRTEPDAIYCSSCGRYLPGSCGSCGAPVELVGSRFCSGCGEQLAAA